MNKSEWALFSLAYLADTHNVVHGGFHFAMKQLQDHSGSRDESWYHSCNRIIHDLYHRSQEFGEDTEIPGDRFASPEAFETELGNYRVRVQGMADELNWKDEKFRAGRNIDEPPYLITVALRLVIQVRNAIDQMQSMKPRA
ncbi:hypothetical protein [Geminicoccus harenae]|uniref:hypothetical protein n=1 Tax=Geminicoccus harenae TaxID=2498453 RepID=UPI00168B933E|nr:hypothetical protein [Geminicoccus harenae]